MRGARGKGANRAKRVVSLTFASFVVKRDATRSMSWNAAPFTSGQICCAVIPTATPVTRLMALTLLAAFARADDSDIAMRRARPSSGRAIIIRPLF